MIRADEHKESNIFDPCHQPFPIPAFMYVTVIPTHLETIWFEHNNLFNTRFLHNINITTNNLFYSLHRIVALCILLVLAGFEYLLATVGVFPENHAVREVAFGDAVLEYHLAREVRESDLLHAIGVVLLDLSWIRLFV